MIHTEDSRHRIGGIAPLRRPSSRARRPAPGPGLLIFSEMWGVATEETRDGRRLRAARLVRDRAQHVLAVGVHRRRAVRSGRQGMAAAAGLRLRQVGRGLPDGGAMAARLAALQRQDRGDRLLHGRPHCVPRGVTRRRRRRHRALRARHRQASRRGSQDGRAAAAPLRPATTSTFRNPRSTRSPPPPPATPISRSSFIRAPGTASSTGRSRPTT